MRLILILAMISVSSSCQRGGEQHSRLDAPSSRIEKVTLRSTVCEEKLRRILWQRCYPSEYAELIKEAEASRNGTGADPFGPPITIPDSDLMPIGLYDLEPIIPRIFRQLGWPLTNGAEAIYRVDGTIEITHDSAAIRAFLDKFPEFARQENKESEASSSNGG